MSALTQTGAPLCIARRQRGLSLIELMIAIVIGMLIMAFLLALYVNVTRANNEMSRMNRQIENGRFAMQLLQNDLVHAGYWADFMPQFDDRSVVGPADMPTAFPDPCKAPATWTAGDRANLIGIPVQNNVGSCAVVASPLAGNDVLVVRHVEPAAGAAACPGGVCFQASQCTLEIKSTPPQPYVLGTANHNLHTMNCEGTAVPLSITSGGTAPVRRFVSNIYYVRDDFTLMRSEFLNGAHQAAQPLIEGIEALRLEYGIDNRDRLGNAVNYSGAVVRGDGVADQFVTAAGLTCISAADCVAANVVEVRIHLLARSPEPTPGYIDSKSYQLGGVTINAADLPAGFKRHVFTTTVRLVNPAGRRETP
jgi:type IV pilus assembly protein PilW